MDAFSLFYLKAIESFFRLLWPHQCRFKKRWSEWRIAFISRSLTYKFSSCLLLLQIWTVKMYLNTEAFYFWQNLASNNIFPKPLSTDKMMKVETIRAMVLPKKWISWLHKEWMKKSGSRPVGVCPRSSADGLWWGTPQRAPPLCRGCIPLWGVGACLGQSCTYRRWMKLRLCPRSCSWHTALPGAESPSPALWGPFAPAVKCKPHSQRTTAQFTRNGPLGSLCIYFNWATTAFLQLFQNMASSIGHPNN